MTAPLPPVKDDPAIVAAFALKADFEQKAAAIRGSENWQESDRYKAAKIAELWNETTAELNRLAVDFDARREARWNELQAKIPTGPDIADDASAADRAVLHAAFRDVVNRARAASPDELSRMYADAKRFGDDQAVRAVFVVANTEGHGSLLKQYQADHPEHGQIMSELNELQNPTGRGFIPQAFGIGHMGQFTEPPEVQQAAQLDSVPQGA